MAKKIIKYLASLAIVVAITSTVIVVYSLTNKSNNTNTINDKLEQEIKYLDTELISVVNSLNNLETEYLVTNNDVGANQTNTASQNGTSSSSSSTRTRRTTKSNWF